VAGPVGSEPARQAGGYRGIGKSQFDLNAGEMIISPHTMLSRAAATSRGPAAAGFLSGTNDPAPASFMLKLVNRARKLR
jgi:hypothetical protein